MRAELNWEEIDNFNSVRAKVPGGWLVRCILNYADRVDEQHWVMGMTFVPDPNHEWGKDEGNQKEGS